MTTETRTLPTLYRDCVLDADAMRAARDSADTRIPMTISSEYAVERGGLWTDPYMEVLSHDSGAIDLGRASGGLPLLMDHDHTKQIGVLEDVTLGPDRKLHGFARFSQSAAAQEIRQDVLDGIRTRTSIGYRVLELTQTTKATRDALATYTASRWALYENSIVSIPADPTVGYGRAAGEAAYPVTVRSLASDTAPQGQENTMSEKDTAAPSGAAPNAPETRATEIVMLCDLVGMADRAAGYITAGTSIDTVRSELAAARRAAQTVTPLPQDTTTVTNMKDRAEDKPWESNQEFYRAVVRAGKTPDNTDVRLKATRAQNTSVGADGGWAVPESAANILMEASMSGGELLSRVTQRPITVGNGYKESVLKEESRANGSRNGGVLGYWIGEDDTIPETQAKMRQVELGLKKVAAIVKLTEEQMEDGPAMESFINEQVPQELIFQKEAAIWSGTGSGQPLGFMNSGAVASVAIEGSQTIANTNEYIWKNAAKMFSRMPAKMLGNAVWFINQELWASILTSVTAAGAGAVPMFTMPGQLAAFPNGAIFGKPIVPVEYASAAGTPGDFVFANLSDYLFVQKGGLRTASSMHVEFLRDRNVLKFVERVDGQPRTRVPLTPFKGSATLSPYITLATRS
jgi:HK97 family phage major capsid protein